MGEITALAGEKLDGLINEAKEDAQIFLRSTEEDFKRWLTLFSLDSGHSGKNCRIIQRKWRKKSILNGKLYS